MDRTFAEAILSRLAKLDQAEYFARPVSEQLAGKPRLLEKYSERIKKPMDFSTIWSRLRANGYRSDSAFLADVKLVFQNAQAFNEAGSPVHEVAAELLRVLENAVIAQTESKADFSDLEDDMEMNMTLDTGEGGEIENDRDADQNLSSVEEASRGDRSLHEEEEDVEADEQFKYGFYLPLPKTSRRLLTSAESGPPPSLYQWEPEPTLELIKAANMAGVALDQLALPCFAVLTPAGADPSSTIDFATMDGSLNKKRRPMPKDDVSLFEPKTRKDHPLFYAAYRKLVSDLCEQALSNGIEGLEASEIDEEEDVVALEGTAIADEIDELRDIFIYSIPHAEFFILFHTLASPEQIERFEKTVQEGDPRMWVRLDTHEEVRRMFGLSGVRVPLPGPKDMFCLFKEPLIFYLEGDTMILRACVSTVHAHNLPKGFGKVLGRGPGRASAGAVTSTSQWMAGDFGDD